MFTVKIERFGAVSEKQFETVIEAQSFIGTCLLNTTAPGVYTFSLIDPEQALTLQSAKLLLEAGQERAHATISFFRS